MIHNFVIGEPCPQCGQIEPHDVIGDMNGVFCQPSESRRQVARHAGDVFYGLMLAEILEFDEVRIRAKLADLRRQMELGRPIRHQSQVGTRDE